MKRPSLDTRNFPVCYGLSHARTERRCRDCAVRLECAPICRRWADRLSLSEQLVKAEAAIAPERHADLPTLYRDLYRMQFGRACRLKLNAKTEAIFARVLTMCHDEEVDPATFIAANMEMLADADVLRRFGFQPNMLSGEKAKARYNIYLRRSNRRFRRGDLSGFKRDTKLGQLRETLAMNEFEVGDFYVRAAVAGARVDWAAAIKHATVDDVWLDFQLGSPQGWTRNLGGDHGVRLEIRLATLKAAVMVAEGLQTGFSTRVGFTTWSWEKFADLAARLFTSVPLEDVDLSGIDGVAYA